MLLLWEHSEQIGISRKNILIDKIGIRGYQFYDAYFNFNKFENLVFYFEIISEVEFCCNVYYLYIRTSIIFWIIDVFLYFENFGEERGR